MKLHYIYALFLFCLVNFGVHAESPNDPWTTVSSDDYNKFTEELIKICRAQHEIQNLIIIPIHLALSLSKFRQFYDCYGKGIGLRKKTEKAENIKIVDITDILRHDVACFALGQCVIHEDSIEELKKLKIK